MIQKVAADAEKPKKPGEMDIFPQENYLSDILLKLS